MMQREGALEDIMKCYASDYNVKLVCTTRRTVKSPKKHDFTSIIYSADTDSFYTEKPYTDIDVIDRIGSENDLSVYKEVLEHIQKTEPFSTSVSMRNANGDRVTLNAVGNYIPDETNSMDYIIILSKPAEEQPDRTEEGPAAWQALPL